MNLKISTELPVPAPAVWEILKLRDTFLFITRYAMRYSGSEGWPVILMQEGVAITTKAHLFGLLPGTMHAFRIVRVDEEAMAIETEEHGALIRRWDHSMTVESAGDSCCRYHDCVTLDAGILTPIIWMFANLFYRYRQARWRLLAALRRHDS